MADTKTDTRSTLGSGDPAAQEEAMADAIERVGDDEYHADPELYWTAQQGPMPDTGRAAALGPQLFMEEQLPDPEGAKAAGFPPIEIPDYQKIAADAVGHPKGPEPGELVRLGMAEVTAPNPVSDVAATAPDDTWTKAEIQAHADEKGIEGVDMNSQSKADMLAAIG
jgi:hypothetical protein